METHQKVSYLFEKYFGGLPVLPTFGNNDNKYHYQPAFGPDEQSFYTDMYETWFTNHSGNLRLDNLEDIRQTMLQGGWYRSNLIPGKLTFLSFNSLQMNYENEQIETIEENAELNWLEAQLVQAVSGENFIVQMYIYETASLWGGKAYENWMKDEYLERFLGLMKTHAEKVLLEVTGHEHLAGLRYSANDTGFYLNKVLFPGFTGAGQIAQPGFATFEFD